MRVTTDPSRAPSSRVTRPPLPRWLAYRFFGARVPYRHRFWVRDDVLGRWHLTRDVACNMTLVVLFQAMLFAGIPLIDFVRGGEYLYWGPDHWLLLVYAGMVGVVALLNLVFPRLGRRRRRDMLLKHDFHEDGTPIIYAPYRPPGYPPPAYPPPGSPIAYPPYPPPGHPQPGHPAGHPPSGTGWSPPY